MWAGGCSCPFRGELARWAIKTISHLGLKQQANVCWGERRELLQLQLWLNYILHSYLLTGLSGTEREVEETDCVPEHLLLLPHTQHCIYCAIMLPISFCPLALKNKRNNPQNSNTAKEALKQPSGTAKFRSLRHGPQKSALLFGPPTALQGAVLHFWLSHRPIFKSPLCLELVPSKAHSSRKHELRGERKCDGQTLSCHVPYIRQSSLKCQLC